MSFDAFVKIDTIEGESTDEKHTGWIEIIRYGIGLKQPASTTASSVGGASTGRTDFSDFIFRKLLDRASPKLALACADGTHIDKVVVELCRGGGPAGNMAAAGTGRETAECKSCRCKSRPRPDQRR